MGFAASRVSPGLVWNFRLCHEGGEKAGWLFKPFLRLTGVLWESILLPDWQGARNKGCPWYALPRRRLCLTRHSWWFFFFSFLQYGCLQGQQFTSLDADCSFHLAYKLCFAPTELKPVHLLHLGTVSSFQQQRHWFGTTQPWNREVIFPTLVHNVLYPSNFEESLWSVPDGWLGRKCEHGPY